MIPMLVGSRFIWRKTAARRSKVWVGAQGTIAALGPSSASAFTIIDETSLETQGKPTIARCRGMWNAWHDTSAAAATSSMVVAAGIAVVSTKAITAGVTAIPNPLTNIEWPWLWWDSALVGNEVITAVGVQSIGNTNRVIDSKAMRKIPPASTLILVLESGPALEGAPDANVAFALRMLLMPS